MTTNAQPNLTPEQVRQYLDGGSHRCPDCRSDQIEGDAVEIEDGTARQGVHCRACGRGWTDLYDLAAIAEDDGPIHEPRARADQPVVGHCGEAIANAFPGLAAHPDGVVVHKADGTTEHRKPSTAESADAGRKGVR